MGVWKQLTNKWFGLSDEPCEVCEILRMQLAESNAERKEMLHRLLDKDKAEPLSTKEEEPISVSPNYIPWRVRQEMLEREDRAKAKLMQERARDMRNAHTEQIDKLEEELGVK